MNTSPAPRTSIMIVEDDTLLMAGLKAVFSTMPDLQVVAEASSGEQALSLLDQLLDQQQLDLIIMDFELPGMNGVQTTIACQRRIPHLKVIMLSGLNRGSDVLSALTAGVTAYCVKGTPPEVMLQGIRVVVSGGVFMDARSAHNLLGTLQAS